METEFVWDVEDRLREWTEVLGREEKRVTLDEEVLQSGRY